ncbi:MAG: hypothetical protein N2Z71_00820 [Caloramator sp.]|nr:hypothetical protein [Caloramator sp.]
MENKYKKREVYRLAKEIVNKQEIKFYQDKQCRDKLKHIVDYIYNRKEKIDGEMLNKSYVEIIEPIVNNNERYNIITTIILAGILATTIENEYIKRDKWNENINQELEDEFIEKLEENIFKIINKIQTDNNYSEMKKDVEEILQNEKWLIYYTNIMSMFINIMIEKDNKINTIVEKQINTNMAKLILLLSSKENKKKEQIKTELKKILNEIECQIKIDKQVKEDVDEIIEMMLSYVETIKRENKDVRLNEIKELKKYKKKDVIDMTTEITNMICEEATYYKILKRVIQLIDELMKCIEVKDNDKVIHQQLTEVINVVEYNRLQYLMLVILMSLYINNSILKDIENRKQIKIDEYNKLQVDISNIIDEINKKENLTTIENNMVYKLKNLIIDSVNEYIIKNEDIEITNTILNIKDNIYKLNRESKLKILNMLTKINGKE